MEGFFKEEGGTRKLLTDKTMDISSQDISLLGKNKKGYFICLFFNQICLFFICGRAQVIDYLSIVQKIPDRLIKMIFLGETENTVRPSIQSGFSATVCSSGRTLVVFVPRLFTGFTSCLIRYLFRYCLLNASCKHSLYMLDPDSLSDMCFTNISHSGGLVFYIHCVCRAGFHFNEVQITYDFFHGSCSDVLSKNSLP